MAKGYRPVIFASQSSLHDSERQSSSERLVNMFPEAGDENRPVLLRSCPGLTSKVAGPGGTPVRAMLETSSVIYYAANAKLWSFNGTTATELGTIRDDLDTTLAWNGTQLAAVADGNYYLYNGTTVSEITGLAFTEFGSVDYMDGYFLFTEKDGARHAISALNDGTSLNALDFASAEYRPDNLVTGFVDHSEWWLFGETTTEVWANTGAVDYPFERVPGAQLERGCLSPATVAKMDNTIFWVGNDRIAYRAVQYAPIRISNHRVEAALRAATTLSAFTYEYEGHKFYCISINNRPSWVYDVATQVWHERASGQALDPWIATAGARLGSNWYVGTTAGDISLIDRVFQENGSIIRREAQSRTLDMGGNRFSVLGLDVHVRAGTGGTVMLQHSRDGGKSWSLERTRSVGAIGVYDERVQMNQLGQMREFALRCAFTDNADFSIYGAGVRVA